MQQKKSTVGYDLFLWSFVGRASSDNFPLFFERGGKNKKTKKTFTLATSDSVEVSEGNDQGKSEVALLIKTPALPCIFRISVNYQRCD